MDCVARKTAELLLFPVDFYSLSRRDDCNPPGIFWMPVMDHPFCVERKANDLIHFRLPQLEQRERVGALEKPSKKMAIDHI